VTAVTTATGYVQITDAFDDKLILIDVNPSDVASHDSDAKYVYLTFDVTDASSTDTATIAGVVGLFEPRYPQVEQVSSSA
jgi:hypothetical protein